MPNVQIHAKRARESTNSNGHGPQAIGQIEEPQTAPEVVGLSEILRGGLGLRVPTSNGGSALLRIADSIFGLIVAAVIVIALAILITGYWLVSSLTEIRVNLVTIQTAQQEMKREYTSDFKVMRAYSTAESNRINYFVGLMTREQQQQANDYDRTHPLPLLPEKKSFEKEQ